MWVVLINNLAVGPFGTPDDVIAGKTEAEEYAQRNKFTDDVPPILPLVEPDPIDGTINRRALRKQAEES